MATVSCEVCVYDAVEEVLVDGIVYVGVCVVVCPEVQHQASGVSTLVMVEVLDLPSRSVV